MLDFIQFAEVTVGACATVLGNYNGHCIVLLLIALLNCFGSPYVNAQDNIRFNTDS